MQRKNEYRWDNFDITSISDLDIGWTEEVWQSTLYDQKAYTKANHKVC